MRLTAVLKRWAFTLCHHAHDRDDLVGCHAQRKYDSTRKGWNHSVQVQRVWRVRGHPSSPPIPMAMWCCSGQRVMVQAARRYSARRKGRGTARFICFCIGMNRVRNHPEAEGRVIENRDRYAV